MKSSWTLTPKRSISKNMRKFIDAITEAEETDREKLEQVAKMFRELHSLEADRRDTLADMFRACLSVLKGLRNPNRQGRDDRKEVIKNADTLIKMLPDVIDMLAKKTPREEITEAEGSRLTAETLSQTFSVEIPDSDAFLKMYMMTEIDDELRQAGAEDIAADPMGGAHYVFTLRDEDISKLPECVSILERHMEALK
jgi:hypothetical protein